MITDSIKLSQESSEFIVKAPLSFIAVAGECLFAVYGIRSFVWVYSTFCLRVFSLPLVLFTDSVSWVT